MRPSGALAAVMLGGLLLTSCGDAPEADADSGVDVVVTTTILGEIVSDLVGDAGTVEVLMQAGQDPHGFALSAQQAAALRRADLVVANGLGLEASLADALESAEEDGVVVLRVAEGLDPLPYVGDHAEGDGHESEDHEPEDQDQGPGLDPHVWLDPVRMAEAPALIAARLVELETERGAQAWEARADELAGQILAAHEQVEEMLRAVPDDCRKLVTNHDAFGYFAARYGFEVIGTVLPGSSTQAEPNARDFAELVRTIRDSGVPAIFTETTQNRSLVDTLVDELGREIEVVELHTGSLGAEAGSSYVGLVTTNAERIAAALADC